MTHHIKILKPFADVIIEGNKTFEIRKNDRGYNRGDFVKFQTITQESFSSFETTHEINDKLYEITYVLSSGFGLQEGYCVFGIKEVHDEQKEASPDDAS